MVYEKMILVLVKTSNNNVQNIKGGGGHYYEAVSSVFTATMPQTSDNSPLLKTDLSL